MPVTSPSGGAEQNWAGNHTYRFRLLRPESLEELQRVVSSHRTVRALGTRHSFNGLPDGDVAVHLGALPEDIVVDAAARTVTCSGAITYGALADELTRQGFALHNLASLPHVSVAGAIATGTHGSGDGNGNLATAVSGLELVLADGDLVSLRRGDPDFDGSVVSLGTLGVVTRVTLDIEPDYEVSQRVYPGLDWERLARHFDEVTGAAYSVSLFTNWDDDGVHAWLKSRTERDDPTELFGVAEATRELHPLAGLDPINSTSQLGIPGGWADRLPHFKMGFAPSKGEEIQSEYHLPREHGLAAIAAMRSLSAELAPVLQVSEIRTVQRDGLWLSPQHDRDSVSFHFTWVRNQLAVERALDLVEAALAPFEPRPHWGKLFLTGAHGAARYERLEDFRALRARLDPDGRFVNDWVAEHLLHG